MTVENTQDTYVQGIWTRFLGAGTSIAGGEWASSKAPMRGFSVQHSLRYTKAALWLDPIARLSESSNPKVQK